MKYLLTSDNYWEVCSRVNIFGAVNRASFLAAISHKCKTVHITEYSMMYNHTQLSGYKIHTQLSGYKIHNVFFISEEDSKWILIHIPDNIEIFSSYSINSIFECIYDLIDIKCITWSCSGIISKLKKNKVYKKFLSICNKYNSVNV